jgi:hypothetical protein
MKKRQRKREEELEQRALKMLSVTAICDGDDPEERRALQKADCALVV